jgi:multicomponent Na+:H+ antiporter subunit D
MSFNTGVALLPPVAIAAPIVMACLLLAFGRALPRAVVDGAAFATAVLDVVLVAIVLDHAAGGRVVTWAARWSPRHGYSVGIVLVSDPIGAGIALLAACLVVLSLVYSWRYFESVEAHYHCLVLLFLAGMVGFAMTGDLFDMFVFFELMGVAAFALTGFKVEDPTAVQGALNFGVVNSLGAYISLMGIGLLYAKVGNLTMPQLADALAGHRPSALLLAAFVCVLTGFLVKAAIAPLHFWLADAHAVAPAPICVLFSGVMVPLGGYGAFRVYWVVFRHVLPMSDVRRAFLAFGVLTAVVGAVMCLAQRHFKRLLAYSTIAHVGLFVVAAGTLTDSGTAGAALYVVGHAGVKSALFLLAGTMLNRYGSVDEIDLFGRGRDARLMPWLFVLGGLALAGLPPFGTGLGKAVSEDAVTHAGLAWLTVLFVGVSAATGGAVLRATGRVYFGLGDRPPRQSDGGETSGSDEEPEVPSLLSRVRLTMTLPIVVLLLGALALGLVPGVHAAAEHAAAMFTDGTAYAQEALTGRTAAVAPDVAVGNWNLTGVLLGLLSTALAVAIAAAGLYWRRYASVRSAGAAGATLMRPLRAVHSGVVGDYVAWLVVGVVGFAVVIGLPLAT